LEVHHEWLRLGSERTRAAKCAARALWAGCKFQEYSSGRYRFTPAARETVTFRLSFSHAAADALEEGTRRIATALRRWRNLAMDLSPRMGP